MIQGVAKGCERKGIPESLRTGMAAASIVPWTDLYEENEKEEDGSRHLHISRRMGKQRYNPRSRIFSSTHFEQEQSNDRTEF